ncbi:MAG: hypothetical protein KGI80_00115 [Verrucomicrobiota bacterium]|nr:hypothetical protein [Verrucomicrobiota bacterium]
MCILSECCQSEQDRYLCGFGGTLGAMTAMGAATGAIAGAIFSEVGPIAGMYAGMAAGAPCICTWVAGTAGLAVAIGPAAVIPGCAASFFAASGVTAAMLPGHPFCFAMRFTLLEFGIGAAGACATSVGAMAYYSHIGPRDNNHEQLANHQEEAQVELPAPPVIVPPIHQPPALQAITETYADFLQQAGEYFDASETERPELLQTYPSELQAILRCAPNFVAAANDIRTNWAETAANTR